MKIEKITRTMCIEAMYVLRIFMLLGVSSWCQILWFLLRYWSKAGTSLQVIQLEMTFSFHHHLKRREYVYQYSNLLYGYKERVPLLSTVST